MTHQSYPVPDPIRDLSAIRVEAPDQVRGAARL